MINHDFSSSFCEANFQLRVHSSCHAVVTIRLITSDAMPVKNQFNEAVKLSDSSSNGSGWHDISLVNDIKVISSGHRQKESAVESLPPFVWCATSSTKLNLEPLRTTEIPLKVCLFTPGTYDLSNYEFHWELKPPEGITDDMKTWTSGTVRGYPFYLTALQVFH